MGNIDMRNRYTSGRREGLCNILVDGKRWEYPVVTVGSNKQLASVDSLSGLVDHSLVLVYPGTYSKNYWYLNARRCHIRGVGVDAQAVVFTTTDNGLCVEGYGSYPSGGNFLPIVENVRLQGSARPFMVWNGGRVLFNRCYLTHGTYSCGTIAGHWTFSGTNGLLVLRNCYISKEGGYMFSNLNLSNVRIERCQFGSSINYTGCTGSFAYADYVTTPTTGYGIMAGEPLIVGV